MRPLAPAATSPRSDAVWLGAESLRLLPALIAWKLVTLALIAFFALRYPIGFDFGEYIEVYRGNHGYVPREPPGASVVFRTWDAEHYLTLARRGYGGPGPENAYYPLYPLLVRALSPLCLGHTLVAALIVSNVLGVLGLLLLHDLLRRRSNLRSADVTIALLCVQPAAFFGSLPYSEALFLFLAALLFRALERGHALRAGAFCALLALTRAVGILLVVPMLIALARRVRWPRMLVACALALSGYVAYLAILGLETGDPWMGFAIQKHFVTAPTLARLFDPLGFLRALANVRRLHGVADSLLDRVAFLATLGSIAAMWKRHGRERLDFAAYTALLAIVPAATTAFMSFLRYASVLFPSFLTLAETLEAPARKKWLYACAAVFLALQLWLLCRHLAFRWAA